MKRILTLLATLLLAAPALAQTAAELFTFKPGTPIRADEMNANFQLLKDHVTDALGLSDLTTEDLAELASLVEQLQALAASGELDGASLEYGWDGTRLGIKRDDQEEFEYVDLTGATGPQGDPGPGLHFEWDGTRLGVAAAGAEIVEYIQLVGATGPQGEQGERGEKGDAGEPGEPGRDGDDGAPGRDGPGGRSITYAWDGTRLGIMHEGDETFEYIDLQGPRGEKGDQGDQGERGDTGPTGAAGPAGPDGLDGSSIAYDWDGTRLGIKHESDDTYEYSELVGPQGPRGELGPEGAQGPRGEQGNPGLQGPTGPAGADGRTLLNGPFAPPAAMGRDGDFFLDTSIWEVYGPKADGAWGAGSSLIGPQGEPGTPAPRYNGGNGIRIDGVNISLQNGQTLPWCGNHSVPQTDGYGGWMCGPAFGTHPTDHYTQTDGKIMDDCSLGDVWLTAGSHGGATIADGRILYVAQNNALFSILGNRYGGDGRNTFALPDLRHAAPRSLNGPALNYVICTVGRYPARPE